MNRPTITEIAKELGISASTVSRSLNNNNRISSATRQRVLDVAKRMHYIPNPAALLLRKNATQNIGVIIPHLSEEFFSIAISGIEDIAMEHGYHLIISQSKDTMSREKVMLTSLLGKRVDGLIISLASETNHYDHFSAIQRQGIPLVFFDRVPPKHFMCNRVQSDITSGVKKAILFLVNKGFQKIALINGPGNLQVAAERLNGYLEALFQYGLKTNPGLIKTTDLSEEDTARCFSQLLDNNEMPDAILTFNDYVAMQAMKACRKQGYIPNQDITFVSFANLPITRFLENPPAASVDQFAYNLGHNAAKLLIQKLQNKLTSFDEITIDSELHIH